MIQVCTVVQGTIEAVKKDSTKPSMASFSQTFSITCNSEQNSSDSNQYVTKKVSDYTFQSALKSGQSRRHEPYEKHMIRNFQSSYFRMEISLSRLFLVDYTKELFRTKKLSSVYCLVERLTYTHADADGSCKTVAFCDTCNP